MVDTIAPWAVMAGGFLIGVGSGTANQLVGYFWEGFGKKNLNKLIGHLMERQDKEDKKHAELEERIKALEEKIAKGA